MEWKRKYGIRSYPWTFFFLQNKKENQGGRLKIKEGHYMPNNLCKEKKESSGSMGNLFYDVIMNNS